MMWAGGVDLDAVTAVFFSSSGYYVISITVMAMVMMVLMEVVVVVVVVVVVMVVGERCLGGGSGLRDLLIVMHGGGCPTYASGEMSVSIGRHTTATEIEPYPWPPPRFLARIPRAWDSSDFAECDLLCQGH